MYHKYNYDKVYNLVRFKDVSFKNFMNGIFIINFLIIFKFNSKKIYITRNREVGDKQKNIPVKLIILFCIRLRKKEHPPTTN
jgi:hypothetical protein